MGWGFAGRRRSGCWRGPWPGRGPFSNLPPWQRPGWLYGRGACWRPPFVVMSPSSIPIPKEQEVTLLENQKKWLQQALEQAEKRLEELQSDKKEEPNK